MRGLTPAKPQWSEVIVFLSVFLRQSNLSQEEIASSDEKATHRNTDSAGEINSGERMFAGGERFAGGCSAAKPRWSEVIIFWYLLLRQSSPLPEEIVSSGERYAHRKTDHATEINSGVRMFAGGGIAAGGRTPAKPRWSEVIVFLKLFPPAEQPFTGGNRQLR